MVWGLRIIQFGLICDALEKIRTSINHHITCTESAIIYSSKSWCLHIFCSWMSLEYWLGTHGIHAILREVQSRMKVQSCSMAILSHDTRFGSTNGNDKTHTFHMLARNRKHVDYLQSFDIVGVKSWRHFQVISGWLSTRHIETYGRCLESHSFYLDLLQM